MGIRSCSRQAPRFAAAYTLFEVVIVVVIIGALSAIAVGPFARSMTIRQADAAARRVAADLALARAHAMRTSAPQTVAFSLPSNYSVSAVADLERSTDAYVVDLSVEPYAAAILGADFNGATDAVFNGYGVPDHAGYVVVKSGSQLRKVTLDADGRATVAVIATYTPGVEPAPVSL